MGVESEPDSSRSRPATRLNTLRVVAASMSLLHALLRASDRMVPARIAYAHCDIPCGIYDPHHAQMYPELHDLVWRALKAGSKARQEINLQAAEDLLKTTNEIARIFWDTKGLPTLKVKAPYPTDRELVVPKLG